jgi:integrase
MRRQSYQRGTITRVRRKNRPDIWKLRYYEYDLFGERTQRAMTIATVDECPTKAHAEKKAEPIRQRLNAAASAVCFRDLADRYLLEAMPRRVDTGNTVRVHVRRLRTRWDDVRLDWMCAHPAEIETWLKQISSQARGAPAGTPLANSTRVLIRARLRRMFHMAMKWQMIAHQRNPIELVELRELPISLHKVRRRQVLTPKQCEDLLALLPVHVRTMATIAIYTGMRISEILGLRWENVDLQTGWIHVRCGAVRGVIDDVKSIDSVRGVPIGPQLARALNEWQRAQLPVGGWLFANTLTEKPFHSEAMRKRWLEPAGRQLGIERLGWHHFRHTLRATLRGAGTPIEDQRDMLGHSSIRVTEIYGREFDAGRQTALKKASAKIVEIFSLAKVGREG